MSRRHLVVAPIVFLLCALLPEPALARIERTCAVAYETQAGWSEETYRSVEFAKGHEIIEHWPAIEMHSLYAMLWFGKGQVVLVKLPTGSLILGGELEERDITSLFSFERRVEGSQTNLSDRKPRRWRLRRCY